MIQTKSVFSKYILLLIALCPLSVWSETKKTILFVRKPGESFEEVYRQMAKELKKYTIKDFVIKDNTPYSEFTSEVKGASPSFLVLMDNRSIEFGIKWNAETPQKVLGMGLMALNLESILKNNSHISGIAFESPAFTLITHFRYIMNLPIKNVLVFYRKSIFNTIIEQSRIHLNKEKIALHAVDVEQNGKDKASIESFMTTKAQEYLSEKDKYDAVWCMLDSALLTKDLFVKFWVPSTEKTKMPFLTGVEQLVNPSLNFATFAVTPNLPDLAGQAVQIVQRLLEEGEKPSSIGVEQLISVNQVLNQKKVKALGLKPQEERTKDVKILE